jgi:hypothetical protein
MWSCRRHHTESHEVLVAHANAVLPPRGVYVWRAVSLTADGRCGAYARPYAGEAERVAACPAFLHTYNHHRGHTALCG